jgi:glycine oxidase
MSDSIHIIGAGAIGLFAARELAGRGSKVVVLESRRIGDGASGAAVGVLQAPTWSGSALAELSRSSFDLYRDVARELLDETDVDIGYQFCGCVRLWESLPRRPAREVAKWRRAGVDARWCERDRLEELIPGYGGRASWGLEMDREAVVHPGSLLEALSASCRKRGVEIRENVGPVQVCPRDDGRAVVIANGQEIERASGTILVTSGSWTEIVTELLPTRATPMMPVRGQVLELRAASPRCVVHFEMPGSGNAYYLVPRGDDGFWIGSTVEEVGFDEATTSEGRAELFVAVREVFPDLDVETISRQWAGLRPKALRLGGPFIGRWPGIDDLWIAAGHYRTGVTQSPGTAKILADALLAGVEVNPSFALVGVD